ncbi:long-chain-fatty-acid--CoA ligase [Actinomadura verrucosospora]|uniref:Long-chain-fatty-acid--CoA ligase n=2 Tax=Actinomadura verrucosospora TaxID=46165 RepID=A0A7D4A417_ACTVE|nr:long-chain-fatty-acid--CoA ligase [Actinomadura verrucosospora]
MSPRQHSGLLARAGAEPPPCPAPAGSAGPAEASATQAQLWFLDGLSSGDAAAYVVPFAFRLRGPLDVAALDGALDAVVRRHEVLRCRFASSDGRLLQVPGPTPPPLAVETVAGEDAMWARARDLAAEPFDLAVGPLVRTRLLRLGERDHLLVWVAHHAVADGWSAGVLRGELAELYGGGSPAPPPLQYADYAGWQRRRLTEERLAGHAEFWRGHLGDAPPAAVPTDRPRPAGQSFRGDSVGFALPGDLAGFAAALRTTPLAVLLSALQTVLARFGGADDAVLGVSVSGRTRPEAEPLIGPFSTTVPLRVDASGDPTVRDLVARTAAAALDGLAHQEIPFPELVRRLGRARAAGRNPLYQVLVTMGGMRPGAPEFAPGLDVEVHGLPNGTARLDLQISVDETADGGFAGRLDYATDLYDRATARRLADCLSTVLGAFADDPDRRLGDVPLVGPDEEERILDRWCRVQEEAAPEGFLQMFAAQAAAGRSAGRAAVVDGSLTWTYRELDRHTTRIAHTVRAHGGGPGTVVAVAAPWTRHQLAGLIGVLKAGATYLPLDPAMPRDRTDHILADSGCTLVLHAGDWEGGVRIDGPAIDDAPDAPLPFPPGTATAYLMYTSGSTGRPKGVAVAHRALGNFLAAMDGLVRRGDAVIALTSPTFDISADELLLPLTVGGRTVIADRARTRDGAALRALAAEAGVTVLHGTPATFRLMIDAGWRGDGVRTALCGGEAMTPRLAGELTERVPEVWNLYGPTEATVWALSHRVLDGGPVPIGRPLSNMTALALDGRLRPVPPGALGELYLGGAGLAEGYPRLPELTAERFAVHERGLRLYRTGDVVSYDEHGVFRFHGRADDQIKLRGFRIEPGEVEACLLRHPAVAEAAVVVHERSEDDRRLVGYVRTRAEVAEEELLGSLRGELPAPMVPGSVVALDAFPRTAAGKTDRRALAARPLAAPRPAGASRPPRTPVERWLTGCWRELLGRDEVGVHDDFFALGGHSLLAARVLARIGALYGVELPADSLFGRPTVAALAELVEETAPAAADDLLGRIEDLSDEEVARLLAAD